LLASVLDGKGQEIPPWHCKINELQTRGLVAYVRSFAPTTEKSGQRAPAMPAFARFDERYRRLQEEPLALHEESRRLSESPPGGALSQLAEPRRLDGHPQPAPPTETPAVQELFRKRCVKCHGSDGTGKEVRDRVAEIPDFTKAPWQRQRTDAQLVASIIEGKGDDMPSARGKISRADARSLVTYVRSFAATARKSGPGQRQ
jgi:mono/diheme cytochrome c family protein